MSKKSITPDKWKWFGHAGHLIVGHYCRFHLCTQVGKYLVSTVGEYWPERSVREIHAEVTDAKWWANNRHRKGDDFNSAYMKRFGYEEIGCDRLYETMVFRAGEPCKSGKCGCGLPAISGCELECDGYNNAGEATRGHMRLCAKWAQSQTKGAV